MANLFGSSLIDRPQPLPSERQSPGGLVWREDLGRWDMPEKTTNYGNLIGAQGPQYSFDGRSLVLDPASVKRPGSFGGMSRELSGVNAMPRIDVAMAGDPQVAQWLQDPAFRQILGLLTTDPDNTQGVKLDQLPAGFAEKFGLDANKGDAVLGFDARQPNLGALGMFDTAGTPFWDQFLEWITPVAAIAGPMVGGSLLGMGAGGSGVTSAAQLGLDSAGMMGGMGSSGLGGLGAFGGGFTGFPTGADGGLAAGGGTVSGGSLGPVPAWAPSQAGAVFNSSIPWAAGLSEGATLAGSGLTTAEMQALGLSGVNALGGTALNAGQNYLSNYFSNPFTAAGKSGGGSMGWLDTLLNVGGNLVSGYMSSNAAKDAAAAQGQAADAANATTMAMFQQNRADLAPWRVAGVNALANLAGGMPNWQKDPGYEFRQAEGLKALDRTASARGLLQSGGAMKDAMRFNQGLASDEFGNAWNRQAGLAGVGQTATTTGANLGQSAAQQVAQNQLGAGNARASGYVGSNNAWSGALGNALNWWNQDQAMQQNPYMINMYR